MYIIMGFKPIILPEACKRWADVKERGIVLVSPISGSLIPNFHQWIQWNGFNLKYHTGFDYAAYIDRTCGRVLGLPPNTEVRAIADGEARVFHPNYGYGTQITIQHTHLSVSGDGLMSSYVHVKPVFSGFSKEVKAGEVIATLHKDAGAERGRLVHLHFELVANWDYYKKEIADPASIFDELSALPIAKPQQSTRFSLSGAGYYSGLEIAHFNHLEIGAEPWNPE
ncbi:Peptidase family M23 [uncultured archaeon]|nr:Peptidase family M23 [uncultured archaeon]